MTARALRTAASAKYLERAVVWRLDRRAQRRDRGPPRSTAPARRRPSTWWSGSPLPTPTSSASAQRKSACRCTSGRRGISYLPQEPSVFRRLTVEQNLEAILETASCPLASGPGAGTAPRRVRPRAGAPGHGYALSGGERRRVEIARALTSLPSSPRRAVRRHRSIAVLDIRFIRAAEMELAS